jgi:hypothetical protein
VRAVDIEAYQARRTLRPIKIFDHEEIIDARNRAMAEANEGQDDEY